MGPEGDAKYGEKCPKPSHCLDAECQASMNLQGTCPKSDSGVKDTR